MIQIVNKLDLKQNITTKLLLEYYFLLSQSQIYIHDLEII